MTDISKSQLNAILSALDGQPRNPNTKDAALRGIGRHAERLGLALDDLLTEAAGLLDGPMSAEEFRAQLRVPDGAPEGATMAERGRLRLRPPAEPEDASTPAVTVSEPADAAPVAATAAPAAAQARVDLKQQLLAACQAAEHWLQAERDRPGETKPDDILHVLRAAIARTEGETSPRQSRQSRQQPRESTKEALLIEMLRRPEAATIAQIVSATGWQAHTVRGAFAGALKKRRGLAVTSEKPEGGERIYRIAG